MPKRSSSASPTMNPLIIKLPDSHPIPQKTLGLAPPPPRTAAAAAANPLDDDELHLLHSAYHHQALLMDDDHHHQALAQPQSPFSSLLLRDPDEDDDEALPDEDDDDEIDPDDALIDAQKLNLSSSSLPNAGSAASGMLAPAVVAPVAPRIDPTPHVSMQFYTFNQECHELMVRCLLESRLPTMEEIRNATPRSVLKSWRVVWKDRNEATAYLTAWKRIQDKLQASPGDGGGPPSLFFKNNPAQRVSHVNQWQDIVASAHADPDLLRHLGPKETLERIKQSWTVGAKFYGIPESFIRVCVASCPICTSSSGSAMSPGGTAAGRSKRRRFEYTESIDVPAKDVQRRLQQLAVKHKVVLCIRQKYIRYKPFMAEVKDYACHRAGEPTSSSSSAKKARVLKREPYQSKRCGCGFRIRAIVPIANYNDKDKTFVYQEEGTAVFKLYAVHSGHEPGPLDGNARIIHRMVGTKAGFDFDPEVYGVMEDSEPESFVGLLSRDGGDSHHMILHQVRDLRIEARLLEGRVSKIPAEMLDSLSHELSDIIYRLRNLGAGIQNSKEALVVEADDVAHWRNEANHHHLDRNDRIFGKDAELIEDDDTDFGSSLGSMVPWDGLTTECQNRKILMRDNSKPDKWLMKDCSDFDEKSILNCVEDEEDGKLIKPLTDPNIVGIQVDGFYSDSTKWYDSPSGLDPGTDSGDGSFRHGEIV